MTKGTDSRQANIYSKAIRNKYLQPPFIVFCPYFRQLTKVEKTKRAIVYSQTARSWQLNSFLVESHPHYQRRILLQTTTSYAGVALFDRNNPNICVDYNEFLTYFFDIWQLDNILQANPMDDAMLCQRAFDRLLTKYLGCEADLATAFLMAIDIEIMEIERRALFLPTILSIVSEGGIEIFSNELKIRKEAAKSFFTNQSRGSNISNLDKIRDNYFRIKMSTTISLSNYVRDILIKYTPKQFQIYTDPSTYYSNSFNTDKEEQIESPDNATIISSDEDADPRDYSNIDYLFVQPFNTELCDELAKAVGLCPPSEVWKKSKFGKPKVWAIIEILDEGLLKQSRADTGKPLAKRYGFIVADRHYKQSEGGVLVNGKAYDKALLQARTALYKMKNNPPFTKKST